jgi:hypothetical protein
MIKRIERLIRKTKRKLILKRYKRLLEPFGNKLQWNPKEIDSGANSLYLTESPELLTKIVGLNFKNPHFQKISNVYASFDRPDGNLAKNWYNITTNYALTDKYCSFDINLRNNSTRYKKAALIRTSKSYLTGHKLRRSINSCETIDVIELTGNISDIAKIYNQYEVVIIIENCKYPGYVSEKFFDAVKCGCKILYWGDSTLVKKLGFKGIKDLEFEQLEYQIQELLNDENNNHTEENFKTLIDIRERLNFNLNFLPSIFLITGER